MRSSLILLRVSTITTSNSCRVSIVRDSDDAIIIKNLDGTITTWNLGAERLYGYTAEEAVGCPISFLVPRDSEDEMAEILLSVSQGKRIDHYQARRVRKDGVSVDVSITVSPVRNSRGEIVGAATIARDITALKRLAKLLQ